MEKINNKKLSYMTTFLNNILIRMYNIKGYKSKNLLDVFLIS